MDSEFDADGFRRPPTPSTTRSRRGGVSLSYTSSRHSNASTASSSRALVEEPSYRDSNLAANGIRMWPDLKPVPDHVAALAGKMRNDRLSPEPTAEEVAKDPELYKLWIGTGEAEVETYFKDKVFPRPGLVNVLKNSERVQMNRNLVPALRASSTDGKHKISTPTPDLLYGYNSMDSFPGEEHQALFADRGREMYATNQYNSLIYPFFIIGFKGVGGNVWVATNQCLGGAATCVNIAERLNAQLQQCDSEEVQPVNSAAFSIAMNGSEARLYISWKHDERNYYMADADCYYLRRADDYIRFRKTARNIVDWGKNDRLHSIRKSLDALIEEARKQTSREAKSRPREEEEEEEDNSKGKRARA